LPDFSASLAESFFSIVCADPEWVQIGQSLEGTHDDQYFGSSVSVNADGTIIAVGSHEGCGGFGHVNVYTLVSTVWTQLGDEFLSTIEGDDFGKSVSLSDSGLMLATGAEDAGDAGQVKVFKYIS
jgi:hypothetical protein